MGRDALTKYDIEVLRILDGEDVPGWRWGAAMGECCEFLKEKGYAKGQYEITDSGKAYLKRLRDEGTLAAHRPEEA